MIDIEEIVVDVSDHSDCLSAEKVGWKAASNGAHKRNWFVMHHEERRYYMNKKGQLIWFASCKAAQRKADALNRRITS